jgi:hypothetical protein
VLIIIIAFRHRRIQHEMPIRNERKRGKDYQTDKENPQSNFYGRVVHRSERMVRPTKIMNEIFCHTISFAPGGL